MAIPENDVLNKQLEHFTNTIKSIIGDNLKSVILYGGVAKGDYSLGKSNVNLLFVFDSVDLDLLDKISVPVQQAIGEFKLSPFILTTSELKPSSDVFAVKLFDMQQHHKLLYGEDCLKPLNFQKEHLRFICEQELRNHLARMKFFYLQNFSMPENLHSQVIKGITSLLINGNTFLFLKKQQYFATRNQIMEQLLLEPEMDNSVLKNLLALREGKVELSPDVIRNAYDELMIQFKQLIKAIKQL